MRYLGPLFFHLIVLLTLTSPAAAQVDWQAMSDEERAAYFERLREAAEADRQLMMAQLGVAEPDTLPPPDRDPHRPAHLVQREGSSNWYDKAGNLHVRSAWGIWSNYDEAHAGGWSASNPLVMEDGKHVTSAAEWWSRRRPEIVESYLVELYGRVPDEVPAVSFVAVGADSSVWDGRAHVRQVIGHIDNARYPAAEPRIEMTLYLPSESEGPVPVVVRAGGFWDDDGALPSPVRQALERGWAFATVSTGLIQMDSGAGFSEGIIGLVNQGHPRDPDDWGVLAAWAWGLSRALDYLAVAPEVDATRAAVQGHSRWGKTALLAGALDTRWAAVFAANAGAMGASLEKRNWGETVDNVASTDEYHWMAGTFLRYAGNWEAMPGDAHFLMALVAPRPLFVTGGTRDQWSDPHGTFLAAVAASPIYELLGADGLGTTKMPAPDEALVNGELAFRNHEGGHTDAPDWPVFYDWIARYFEDE